MLITFGDVEYQVGAEGGWGVTHTCRADECRCCSYSIDVDLARAWGLSMDGKVHVKAAG